MPKTMIRQFTYLILILVAITAPGSTIVAQNRVDKVADEGLMVRQIPNSESDASCFFRHITTPNDTIYAVIFRPSNCPRCDTFITPLYKTIKKNSRYPVTLVAVYPDSIIAKNYIRDNGITYDNIIYDTTESFNNFLSFSAGYLHVGYLLKVVCSAGNVIVGTNIVDGSAEFIKEMNVYNHPKEKKNYRSFSYNDKLGSNQDFSAEPISFNSVYSLEFPIESAPSEILYQPAFQGNHLVFNDKLSLKSHLYKINGSIAKLQRIIDVDSLEGATFSKLPKNIYDKLRKRGDLKNMPLQPFFKNDSILGVAYSLPDVWMSGENNFNYLNKPCYIERSVNDSSYKKLIAINPDFEEPFFYEHFYMKPAGDNVILNVERLTYPYLTNTDEFMGIAEMDPFKDQFYNEYQPTLALFGTTDGLLKTRFGKLPTFAKHTKTGYRLSSTVFDSYGDEAVYAGQYDGMIYLSPVADLGCDDCAKQYRIRLYDESELEAPDSSMFYTSQPELRTRGQLKWKIHDIKADVDNIYCIISTENDQLERPDKETFIYAKIRKDNGLQEFFAIPKSKDTEKRLMSCGLRRLSNGVVEPFLIFNKKGKWTVHTLSDSL